MEPSEIKNQLSRQSRRHNIFPYIILTLAITLVDIFVKYLIQRNLEMGEIHNLLGNFLRLTYILNYGGVFGTKIGSNHFYLLSSVIVVGLVIYFLARETGKNKVIDLALYIVLGGALGNLFDRIRMGAVVDFIDVNFFKINILGYQFNRWPTFNIADVAVTIGMIMLILAVLFRWGYPRQQPQEIENIQAAEHSE